MAFALVLVAAVFACNQGSPRTSPEMQPDSIALMRIRSATETTVLRVPGMAMRRESGPDAVARWKADVAPTDSGGECNLARGSRDGTTYVTAVFPTRSKAHTGMTLTFDSTGKLIRFSDRRGGVNDILTPTGATRAQRDSLLLAAMVAKRSTDISIDYIRNRGLAINSGGGIPGNAVEGPIGEFETAEQFGPPKARIARIRRLCGV